MEMSVTAFRREFRRFSELVRRADGRPFTSFDVGLPDDWEGHKQELRREARDILGSDRWQQTDLGSGRILNSVIQVIELKQNNLVQWHGRWGPARQSHRALLAARSSGGARREALERSFLRFFAHQVTDQAAFEEFMSLVGKRYDLIAYFFFLENSDRFMPIAPDTFDKAFGLLGMDLRTTKRCSWPNYRDYNEALGMVRQSLRAADPRLNPKLIDAHSFCWLLVRLTAEKASRERRKYQALVTALEAGEQRVEVWRRTEQTMLRRYVLGGRDSGACCLCGQVFPIAFLVAAHIKPRSRCERAEKDDRLNVVAMCRFGCDEMFERGYVYVSDEKICLDEGKMTDVTAVVRAYGRFLSHRVCSHWKRSRAFFDWHASHHNGRASPRR